MHKQKRDSESDVQIAIRLSVLFRVAAKRTQNFQSVVNTIQCITWTRNLFLYSSQESPPKETLTNKKKH